MSAFNPKQLRALSRKLDRRHVKCREAEDGREISYLEGWFVVAEANAIFGFGGWDRETVQFERVFERTANGMTSCGYLSRVRITVRAGDKIVTREGTGFGSASAKTQGEAHERALKAAETDATKRALATFGNRFGLALYDKEQAGVTDAANEWVIFDVGGAAILSALSAEGYCSGLRQIIEKLDPDELAPWREKNASGLARLRERRPGLKTSSGTHYADILHRLIERRLQSAPEKAAIAPTALPVPLGPLAPSKIANGERIDKSTLLFRTERRARDKDHLRAVAAQPCLICGRQPCHSHHVTFAQKRGLAQKVSDEFTVPLCALHHDALHRSGNERAWWAERGIDPLAVASELWRRSRASSEGVPGAAAVPADQNDKIVTPASASNVTLIR